MSKSSEIDRRTARRRFERAAATYEKSARLESEVAARMLERLDYVRIAPRRVLDAASGPPRRALGKRYPDAEVIALDFAAAMLRAGKTRLFGKNPLRVCADLERLPLAAEAVDLVWCNMALHWLPDPQRAFAEFARVLTPEGLLMFSTLGPDTLKELRSAFSGFSGPPHVHSFIDMHDIGDMLVAAGFAGPEAWAERLARRRRTAMVAALPDALDLVAVGTATGRTPVALFSEIATGTAGPLAAEMALTVAEIEAGARQPDALAALRDRTGAPELGAVGAALERSRRYGSPLAEQLHAQAQTLRTEEQRRIEERAARAAPKIQLVVAMVLVPSALLAIAAALVAHSGALFSSL